jgi:hypothetical protein
MVAAMTGSVVGSTKCRGDAEENWNHRGIFHLLDTTMFKGDGQTLERIIRSKEETHCLMSTVECLPRKTIHYLSKLIQHFHLLVNVLSN